MRKIACVGDMKKLESRVIVLVWRARLLCRSGQWRARSSVWMER